MVLTYDKYKALETFVTSHAGATKPNCFDLSGRPYYAYENAVVDGIAPTDTNDSTLINTLFGFINSNQITKAITLANVLIASGFEFDRQSYIATPFVSGETPSISLLFAVALKRLYEITDTLLYDTTANVIINRLKTNMPVAGDANYQTSGASSFVCLYNALGQLIPNSRGGTYISDLVPEAWERSNNTDELDEIVQMFYDSQKQIEHIPINSNIFYPYYTKNVPENAVYPHTERWLFDGNLTDSNKKLIHTYQGVLNLSRYYHHKLLFGDGEIDLVTRQVLDNFFNWVSTFYNTNGYIPTEVATTEVVDFSMEEVDWSSTTITFDMMYYYIVFGHQSTLPTFDDETHTWDSTTITFNDIATPLIEYNIKYMAMCGIAALLKYQVDHDDVCYEFAENMVNKILAYQQANGSVKSTTYTYIEEQLLTYEFFTLFRQVDYKSFSEIINSALKMLDFECVYDSNRSYNPNVVAETYCNDGLIEISRTRMWEWAYEEYTLPWTAGTYYYDLTTYGINSHRIEAIEYFYNTNYLKTLEKTDKFSMEQNYKQNPTYTGAPQYYSIDNNILYLFPVPDINYGIQVCHYKEEPEIVDFNSKPSVYPNEWLFVLKNYIAWKVAEVNSHPLTAIFKLMYLVFLSYMEYMDSIDISATHSLPTNIDLGVGVGVNG